MEQRADVHIIIILERFRENERTHSVNVWYEWLHNVHSSFPKIPFSSSIARGLLVTMFRWGVVPIDFIDVVRHCIYSSENRVMYDCPRTHEATLKSLGKCIQLIQNSC